jgi:hypothetical protein
MAFITAPAETRRLTIDDAVAAAQVLRELDAGHEDAAFATAVEYSLDGLDAEMLEHLCDTFGVEI